MYIPIVGLGLCLRFICTLIPVAFAHSHRTHCFSVYRRAAITPPIKNSSRKFHSSLHSIVLQLCRMECKEVWSDQAYATETIFFPHRRRSTCTDTHTRPFFFAIFICFLFSKWTVICTNIFRIFINEMRTLKQKMWEKYCDFSWKIELFRVGFWIAHSEFVFWRRLNGKFNGHCTEDTFFHSHYCFFFRFSKVFFIDTLAKSAKYKVLPLNSEFPRQNVRLECVEWRMWFILMWIDSWRW